MTLTPDQLVILDMIDAGGTHAFYTPDFVYRIEAAFGFSRGALLEEERANTGMPKGLRVEGVERGARVCGASSWNVTDAIARKLGVSYAYGYGRGTNQRRALEAIRAAID